jgi:hypothetical protein
MNASILISCFAAFLVLAGQNACDFPQELSSSEISEDLAAFQEGLEERFSYLKANKAGYKNAIKAIRKKAKNGMSMNDLGIELTRVLALFIDGHASISGFQQPEGYLPFLIEPAPKRFVAFLPDRSGLLEAGYPYILEMDGKAMKDWIDAAMRLVPKGSPHYVTRHCLRQLRYIQFMRGELGLETGSPLTVKLASEDGKDTKTSTLDVSGRFPTYGVWPLHRTKILEGNIAYLRIPSMDDDAVEEIHEWMPRFRKTDGLIIDVRDNGGGSRLALLALFPYLMKDSDPPHVANTAAYRLFRRHEKDHLAARFMYREDWKGFSKEEKKAIKTFKSRFKPEWRLPKGEFSGWHYLVLSRKEAPGLYYYEKPVVILMNEKCFSATDIFLGAFKEWRNVTLAGRPSGGGSARKQGFSLPNSDLRINVASMASFQKSGKLFDGHGVEPDVHIEPAPEYYLRNGRDNILEKALEIIKKGGKGPGR